MVESALWLGVSEKEGSQALIQPNWVQTTSPNTPTAHLNGVYRCEWDEASIDSKIKETINHYKNLKIPFRWKVSESSRPIDLPQRLKDHGLFHKETLFGLFADPKKIMVHGNQQVKIEELTLNNLEDWLNVQETSWRVPPQGISFIRNKMSKDLEKSIKPYINYLAYMDSTPIGSAAVKYYSKYAFLMGAAVDPRYRKQGVYKALLACRIAKIKDKGLPVVNHCLENTSAPICIKLGFEKIVSILSFQDTPQSAD